MTLTALFLHLFLLALPFVAKAEPYNVTVDDSDPSITWAGSWSQTLPGFGQPFNGTYRTAKRDPTAYAEFTFTGTAVYFISARWPYAVSTQLTLDPGSPSAQPLLLRLEDYETKTVDPNFGVAMILASATGLENKEHTVRVSVGTNETYAVFDAFLYTTLDSPATAASSSSAPAFTALHQPESVPTQALPSSQSTSGDTGSSSGSSSGSDAAGKKPLNLAAIFGPICAVVALFLAACGYFVWRFKQRVGTKAGSVDDIYSKDTEKEPRASSGRHSGSTVYEIDLPTGKH